VPCNKPGGSENLDFVGDDWEIRGFHHGVLGQLLGIVGPRLASQNQASILDDDLKASDFVQETGLDMGLKSIQPREALDVTVKERSPAFH
jgi:hypothetical protein